MKYKVIKLIKTPKFEGVVMKDEDGKQYITNGVFKWEAVPKKIAQCTEVKSIDKERFLKYWNKYFSYCKLEF